MIQGRVDRKEEGSGEGEGEMGRGATRRKRQDGETGMDRTSGKGWEWGGRLGGRLGGGNGEGQGGQQEGGDREGAKGRGRRRGKRRGISQMDMMKCLGGHMECLLEMRLGAVFVYPCNAGYPS